MAPESFQILIQIATPLYLLWVVFWCCRICLLFKGLFGGLELGPRMQQLPDPYHAHFFSQIPAVLKKGSPGKRADTFNLGLQDQKVAGRIKQQELRGHSGEWPYMAIKAVGRSSLEACSVTDRDRQRQTRTDRDRQRQTETDKDRQGHTETDRDTQGQTGTNRDRQRQSETDRDRQGQTKTCKDRQGQADTDRDRQGQTETDCDRQGPFQATECAQAPFQATDSAQAPLGLCPLAPTHCGRLPLKSWNFQKSKSGCS